MNVVYRDFHENDLPSILSMGVNEGWDSFKEPDLIRTALTSPGGVVKVATDGDVIIGFIQLQTDRAVHAHISNILISESYRGRGIGKELVEKAFADSGARYIDLTSTEGPGEFYKIFRHEEHPGYRIYPGTVPR